MKLFIRLNKEGQSLVEVIVACGILAIALTAMMSMVTASKNLLYQSEDQMKATSLAQEGIEIAKHQRDIGCGWDNVKSSVVTGTNVFYITKDSGGSDDETLTTTQPNPFNIANFDDFSRTIEIKELSDSQFSAMDGCSGGASDSCFQTTGCGNVETDYDCRDKYYFMKVIIQKGDATISEVSTIMSKE